MGIDEHAGTGVGLASMRARTEGLGDASVESNGLGTVVTAQHPRVTGRKFVIRIVIVDDHAIVRDGLRARSRAEPTSRSSAKPPPATTPSPSRRDATLTS